MGQLTKKDSDNRNRLYLLKSVPASMDKLFMPLLNIAAFILGGKHRVKRYPFLQQQAKQAHAFIQHD